MTIHPCGYNLDVCIVILSSAWGYKPTLLGLSLAVQSIRILAINANLLT